MSRVFLQLGLSASVVLGVSVAHAWISPLSGRPNMSERNKYDLGLLLESEFEQFNRTCGISGGPKVLLSSTYSPLPSELQREKIQGFHLIYIPSVTVDAGQLWRAFRRIHKSTMKVDLLKSILSPTVDPGALDPQIDFVLDATHWNYEATCATTLNSALSANINAGVLKSSEAAQIAAKKEGAIQLAYGQFRSALADNIVRADQGMWSADIQNVYQRLWQYYSSAASSGVNGGYALQSVTGVSMTRRSSTFSQSSFVADNSFSLSYAVVGANGELSYKDSATSGYRTNVSTFFLEGNWDINTGILVPKVTAVPLPLRALVAQRLGDHIGAIDRGTRRTTWGTEYVTTVELPHGEQGSGVSKAICQAGWTVSVPADAKLKPSSSPDAVIWRYDGNSSNCEISLRFEPVRLKDLRDSDASADVTFTSKLIPAGGASERLTFVLGISAFQGGDVSLTLKNPGDSVVACGPDGLTGLNCQIPILVQASPPVQLDASKFGIDVSDVGGPLIECRAGDSSPFVTANVPTANITRDAISLQVAMPTGDVSPTECRVTSLVARVWLVNKGSPIPIRLPVVKLVPKKS